MWNVSTVDNRVAHFPGSTHLSHEIHPERDEAKRQKDYWHRAAEDAGHHSERGLSTGGKTVLDVAIRGSVYTGVEVQRTCVTTSAALNRMTRSYQAGWLSLWFVESGRHPAWYHRVPTVGCNSISWGGMPPRRAATATGLRRVKPAKCTITEFNRCPVGELRLCGGFHPKFVPWGGVTVDEIAERVPAKRAVALPATKEVVYVVPVESLAIYRELAGDVPEYTPGGKPLPVLLSEGQSPPNRVPSRWPPCVRCGESLFYLRPGRDHCERCRPILTPGS